MPKDRAQFNVRVDLPTLYTLDIACRIEDCSQSELVRRALSYYFKNAISPHQLIEFQEPFPGHTLPTPEMMQKQKAEAKQAQMQHPLSEYAELLWEEQPFDRLMKLMVFFNHLMTPFDKSLLDYLYLQPQFITDTPQGKTLNRDAIVAADWAQIQADVFSKETR